jgi:hypothetical protein
LHASWRNFGFTEKTRRDVPPINDRLIRHGAAGECDSGGQKIDRASDGIDAGVRRNLSRPPGNCRLAHPAFPGASLTTTQWTGATAIGALDEPWSVVAGENDESIFGQIEFVQGIEQLPGAPIDFLDPVTELAII